MHYDSPMFIYKPLCFEQTCIIILHWTILCSLIVVDFIDDFTLHFCACVAAGELVHYSLVI